MIISIVYISNDFTSRGHRINIAVRIPSLSHTTVACYPTYLNALRNPASPSIVSLKDAASPEPRSFLISGTSRKFEDDSADVIVFDMLGERRESPSL